MRTSTARLVSAAIPKEIDKLKFLSDSSVYFLSDSTYDEIFTYVCNRLNSLTGCIVVVSEYDPNLNSTVIRAINIKKSEQNYVSKLLGSKIVGLTLGIDEKVRRKFLPGRLKKVSGGVRELSFNRFPARLSKIIEKTLKIESIYAMPFVVEQDFLGTVILAAREGIKLEDAKFVETFINQAGVALKHKKTEKKLHQVRLDLEKEKKHLKEMERVKDEFIGMASHELKTPLTSTKIYAELLGRELDKKGEAGRDARRYLASLETEMGKMEELIRNLLDMSKIQKRKLVFEKKPFDLNDLVEETLKNFQHTVRTHKIVKRGKVGKKVIGHEDRVRQVLVNLLNNAVKYSPNADRVEVKLMQTPKEVRVSVTDHGIGIAPENQPKVFERYYRVGGLGRGFGLGLYIAYEIVRLHEGRIWVESELGRGSTFHFTLPISRPK